MWGEGVLEGMSSIRSVSQLKDERREEIGREGTKKRGEVRSERMPYIPSGRQRLWFTAPRVFVPDGSSCLGGGCGRKFGVVDAYKEEAGA